MVAVGSVILVGSGVVVGSVLESEVMVGLVGLAGVVCSVEGSVAAGLVVVGSVGVVGLGVVACFLDFADLDAMVGKRRVLRGAEDCSKMIQRGKLLAI